MSNSRYLLLPLVRHPVSDFAAPQKNRRAAAQALFSLLLVMLMGFVERKDGLQHEFTKPGIHAGSTLLMDNSVFLFIY